MILENKFVRRDIFDRIPAPPSGMENRLTRVSRMTWMMLARSGTVPALHGGHNGLGCGERETRGERRGRGERLPSGSRFVFPVVVLLASMGAAPLGAQDRPSGFTIGLRMGGVVSTRLVSDAIGKSILPDSALQDRFARDSVYVRAPLAPDLTIFAGLPLSEDTDLRLAAGYTFGSVRVERGEESRDAGPLGVAHGVLSVEMPIRGVLTRIGAGALWFREAEITALRDARVLNPLLELAAAHRWQAGPVDLEAALVGQVTQFASAALEDRRGSPGFIYRLGLELGVARRFNR